MKGYKYTTEHTDWIHTDIANYTGSPVIKPNDVLFTKKSGSMRCHNCGLPTIGTFKQNGQAICGYCLEYLTQEIFDFIRKHEQTHRKIIATNPNLKNTIIQMPISTLNKFKDVKIS